MSEEKLVETLLESDRRYQINSLRTGGHRLVKPNPTIYHTQR